MIDSGGFFTDRGKCQLLVLSATTSRSRQKVESSFHWEHLNTGIQQEE